MLGVISTASTLKGSWLLLLDTGLVPKPAWIVIAAMVIETDFFSENVEKSASGFLT